MVHWFSVPAALSYSPPATSSFSHPQTLAMTPVPRQLHHTCCGLLCTVAPFHSKSSGRPVHNRTLYQLITHACILLLRGCLPRAQCALLGRGEPSPSHHRGGVGRGVARTTWCWSARPLCHHTPIPPVVAMPCCSASPGAPHSGTPPCAVAFLVVDKQCMLNVSLIPCRAVQLMARNGES